eukprot:15434842-Alexandrium_andersonii.AAC.1
MVPEALFEGVRGGGREHRKLLETVRNCRNPLEPPGTAEDPPLRTLRCRPMINNNYQQLFHAFEA